MGIQTSCGRGDSSSRSTAPFLSSWCRDRQLCCQRYGSARTPHQVPIRLGGHPGHNVVGGWEILAAVEQVGQDHHAVVRPEYVERYPRYGWQTLTYHAAGTIHTFFEGYFAYNGGHMAGASDLFGQLWKEYAKSDSRYLTWDPFTLCMETVTAVCIFMGTLAAWKANNSITGLLGTSLLCHGIYDHRSTPIPLPNPSHRFAWPNIRPDPLLRHQLVRSVLQGYQLLPA